MRVFRHKFHIVYELSKKLVIIKKLDKIKFWFPKEHRPPETKCGLVNIKFIVHPHKQFKYFHWLIRLPFFYWEKNNGGFKIGLPNLYLWNIR